eukprot:1161320-Pelagomonas_calceolata.AAC.10
MKKEQRGECWDTCRGRLKSNHVLRVQTGLEMNAGRVGSMVKKQSTSSVASAPKKVAAESVHLVKHVHVNIARADEGFVKLAVSCFD